MAKGKVFIVEHDAGIIEDDRTGSAWHSTAMLKKVGQPKTACPFCH
jgi:hypothetical protein